MEIDRAKFLKDGYLVLRNVIPPDLLDPVRRAYEKMLHRQRDIWSRNRAPDTPPAGVWETAPQPRVILHHMGDQVDAETALAIEIWNHENLQGVSSRLLGEEDAGVTEMMMMCNPRRDRGPARWHRDFSPSYCAPLAGYIGDLLENGPRYVQWNLPLYDDSVLWVVPGSHVRFATEAENAELDADDAAPLSTSVQTHLNAGDGVAYILPILHWGSNYSTLLRRTIHGGFSAFTTHPDQRFLDQVSAPVREAFARWETRSSAKMQQTAQVLRAALDRDAAGYQTALDRLHPGRGPRGQLLSTIFLSKAARRINDLKAPDFDRMPAAAKNAATSVHPMTLQWGRPIAAEFTAAAAAELWSRYSWMDAALQAEEEQALPGFQGRPTRHRQQEIPPEISLEEFFSRW